MTVATTNNRKDYTGNNSTDTYAFDFPIFEDTDLEVYEDAVLLTLTTDYTVTLDGAAPNTGTITLVAGNLGSGVALALVRNVPATQGVDLVTNDAFPPDTVEAELDKLTVLVQQVDERLDRAVLLDPSSTQGAKSLEDLVADQFLRVASDASGVVMSDLPNVTALESSVAAAAASESDAADSEAAAAASESAAASSASDAADSEAAAAASAASIDVLLGSAGYAAPSGVGPHDYTLFTVPADFWTAGRVFYLAVAVARDVYVSGTPTLKLLFGSDAVFNHTIVTGNGVLLVAVLGRVSATLHTGIQFAGDSGTVLQGLLAASSYDDTTEQDFILRIDGANAGNSFKFYGATASLK